MSILASAYKRRAWISAADRRESLEHVTMYYKEACELPGKKEDPEYPLLNWLTAEVALGWQSDPPARPTERVKKFAELLADARKTLKEKMDKERNFWRAIMIVDAQLVETLGADLLNETTVAKLTEEYASVVRAFGSELELGSVWDQFDFLIEMASKREGLPNRLRELQDKLKTKTCDGQPK